MNLEKVELKNEIVINKEQISKYLDLYGFKNIEQREKELFIEICVMNNLNPFKRDAYITAYGEGQYRQFAILTGYEVYIRRAEESGLLDGWKVETTGKVSDNSLKAIITIYRKNFSHPFVHEVYYAEYVQKTKQGVPNKFWAEKPVTMIKKVAISQGFRLAFNQVVGGLHYTQDEMSQTIDVQHEEVKVPKKQKTKAKITPEKLENMLKSSDVINLKKALIYYEFSEEQLKQIEKHISFVEKIVQSTEKEEIEHLLNSDIEGLTPEIIQFAEIKLGEITNNK